MGACSSLFNRDGGGANSIRLTSGSLFSGIGGFELGCREAGIETLWQVEIDPSCRNILARHFPNTVRYNDVRECGSHNLEPVDLIYGGFPCQDLSVAGKRNGLAGERSGLWFEFHRIITELWPRWVVVENVPGLLNSNEGLDFAVVLGGLTGVIPEVPPGGWGNAGLARGPIYNVAYRILDAQFFGVAQRRRRVFIVGYLGEMGRSLGSETLQDRSGVSGLAAKVLFESDCSAWDTPPRREKGERVARVTGTLSANTGGTTRPAGNANELDFCVPVANPLCASGRGTERAGESRGQDTVIPVGISGSDLAYALRAEASHSGDKGDGGINTTFVAYNQRGGYGVSETGDLSPTLQAEGGTHQGGPERLPLVASFDPRNITSKANRTRVEPGLPANTLHQEGLSVVSFNNRQDPVVSGDMAQPLGAQDNGLGVAIVSKGNGEAWTSEVHTSLSAAGGGQAGQGYPAALTSFGVRRLVPVECERLQGFPDDYTEGQSDSTRYRQLGNAVCKNVAEWIMRRIVQVEASK